MPFLVIFLLIKFFLPLTIFKFPFISSWLNYFYDTADGDILMHFNMNSNLYQLIDKSADYLTYIVMLYVGLGWKIRNTVITLFIYRTIGQILFFINSNDLFFFIFPNFLEPLFLIYSFLIYKYKNKGHIIYKNKLYIIWSLIIVFKMWNEWSLHVSRNDLSTSLFGFNN